MVDDGPDGLSDSADASLANKASQPSSLSGRRMAAMTLTTEVGTVSGTVKLDGNPATDVCVHVMDPSTDPSSDVGSTCTLDSNGGYLVGDIPAGEYQVWFNPSDQFVEGQWFGADDWTGAADTVVVTAQGETTGVSADLTTGGIVAGSVTDESGAVAPGVCVTVWALGMQRGRGVCPYQSSDYEILMPPGDYLVEFTADTLRTEWFDDTYNSDSAQVVTVAARAITPARATLAPGGAIAGTVHDDDTNLPIAGVCVSASLQNEPDNHPKVSCTDDSGHYTLGGLAEGSYMLFFDDRGDHIDEWNSDKSSLRTRISCQ